MQALDLVSPIHRISVAQFHRMIDAGCFGEGDRVELIDGEMRDMAPIGPPHGGTTDSLTMLFAPKLVGKAIVRVQGALVLDDGTELYPDISVLKYRDDHYRKANHTGEEVLLVIEVADSSLALDLAPSSRSTPAPASAATGWWICATAPCMTTGTRTASGAGIGNSTA